MINDFEVCGDHDFFWTKEKLWKYIWEKRDLNAFRKVLNKYLNRKLFDAYIKGLREGRAEAKIK